MSSEDQSRSGIPWGWPQWVALGGAAAIVVIVMTPNVTLASAGGFLLPLALLAGIRVGGDRT